MLYADFQNQQPTMPVAICDHCKEEIYAGDYIYNLDEIYMNGTFIVHEDCLLKSLEESRELVTEYFFDDLCRLQDIFAELLFKMVAFDMFDNWEEECDRFE